MASWTDLVWAGNGLYARQSLSGHLHFGSGGPAWESTVAEVAYTVTPGGMQRAARRMCDFMPGLQTCRYCGVGPGVIGPSADGVPVLEACAQPRGLIIASGFGGNGFVDGPAVGQVVAAACDARSNEHRHLRAVPGALRRLTCVEPFAAHRPFPGRRDEALGFFSRTLFGRSPAEIAEMRADPSWKDRLASAHTVARELRVAQEYRYSGTAFQQIKQPTLLLIGELSTIRSTRLGRGLARGSVLQSSGDLIRAGTWRAQTCAQTGCGRGACVYAGDGTRTRRQGGRAHP